MKKKTRIAACLLISFWALTLPDGCAYKSNTNIGIAPKMEGSRVDAVSTTDAKPNTNLSLTP